MQKHILKIAFWLAMLIAQVAAFLIFAELADVSQWIVQSSREFTMTIWYNRYLTTGVAIVALVAALLIWRTRKSICPKPLLGVLLFFFFYLKHLGGGLNNDDLR